jgi:hypothetical protein
MRYISDAIFKEFATTKKHTLPEDPFGSVMGFVRAIVVQPKLPP